MARDSKVDSGKLKALLAERDAAQETLQRNARETLARIFVLVKLAFLYDVKNDAMRGASEKLAESSNRLHDPATAIELAFLADGMYLNRVRVKVDLGGFDQAEYLHTIWSHVGVGAVALLGRTVAADWLELAAALQQAVGSEAERHLFGTRVFARLRLRPLDGGPGGTAAARTSERVRALRAYAALVVAIEETLARLRGRRRASIARVKRVVQELISCAGGNTDLLLAVAGLARHKLGPAHHLANTTVLAVVLGRGLALERKPLCDLALQAALHCLGRAFTDDPRDALLAAATVQKIVGVAGASAALMPRVVAAAEAHRWIRPLQPEPEGTLPPSAMARVIAVAHAFDLLTTGSAERPALRPDQAMGVMVAEAGGRYDAEMVRLLAAALGAFPVGSLVSLRDGSIAVVISPPADPAHDVRPRRIKVIRDADGRSRDGPVVEVHGADLVRCVGDAEVNLNVPAFLLD